MATTICALGPPAGTTTADIQAHRDSAKHNSWNYDALSRRTGSGRRGGASPVTGADMLFM